MPLSKIIHLDEREAEFRGFEDLLEEFPIMLERASSAYRTFIRARDKMLELTSVVYELKGIVAGLALCIPEIVTEQEITRKKIEGEKIDEDIGKDMISALSRAAKLVTEKRRKNYEELKKAAGRLEGFYWSAEDALNELERAVKSLDEEEDEEDEDANWKDSNGSSLSSQEASTGV